MISSFWTDLKPYVSRPALFSRLTISSAFGAPCGAWVSTHRTIHKRAGVVVKGVRSGIVQQTCAAHKTRRGGGWRGGGGRVLSDGCRRAFNTSLSLFPTKIIIHGREIFVHPPGFTSIFKRKLIEVGYDKSSLILPAQYRTYLCGEDHAQVPAVAVSTPEDVRPPRRRVAT